jgi:hypothetical protein
MEKKISRKLLLWIFVWFIVLGAVLALFGHLGMDTVRSALPESRDQTPEAAIQALEHIKIMYWTVLASILVITGFLLWLNLSLSVKRVISDFESEASPGKGERQQKKMPSAKPAPQEKQTDVHDDQRRALLLLCLLQREGRLVDFLEEDLQSYEDAQVGAAVRSIQESCKKSLNEYLALKAVIDQEEGEEVIIQAGFDANEIRLTGKVTGEPPFKGILQHRGWQVTNFDLPALSGSQDPGIIAPAEVEIA